MSKGIIHSGGALGADACFGNGVECGYEVLCHSFQGQKVYGKGTRVEHSAKELQIADSFLARANQVLQRKFPPSSLFVLNLLRRNYYQIVQSEFVIAAAPLSPAPQDTVEGGTGWAVEMAYQLNVPVYLWNTRTKSWYSNFSGLFLPHIGEIPNRGVFAGIGSRNIDAIDAAEIKKLLIK